jgi:hypothetical protein
MKAGILRLMAGSILSGKVKGFAATQAKLLLLGRVCVLVGNAAERRRNLGSGAAVGGTAER